MTDRYILEKSIPYAPLKIIAMESMAELGKKINDYIVEIRHSDLKELFDRQRFPEYGGYYSDTYLCNATCPRFDTGEAKGILSDSVRGCDLYILTDVTNHSIPYTMHGYVNYKSPDDHYQDLKRIICAAKPTARRINVIMPFLYESRQHKRAKRESLDCACSLEELANMGIKNIITFDAHDPRVQNSIPLKGFDNFTPPYQFMKALFKAERNLKIDKEHLIIISPDEGAMERSVYFANNLRVDLGMFYKRRDYSTVINGRNPIVAHEYLGPGVKSKTVIIVDDMISSGESMLDTAKELKKREAEKVIVCCTFGLFTNGFESFDKAYEEKNIDYVITTNLNYRPPELLEKPWYLEAQMGRFLASIINTMNHDSSVSDILSPTEKIQTLIQRYNAGLSTEGD